MTKQLIISVSREYAGGGHEIAEKLAEKFSLPLYDYDLLKEIAAEKGLDVSNLQKYDELPKSKLFSRKVRGHSSSPQENIAHMQFEYLKKKAAKGESFVVVGRCSETVLKEFDCMIPIFIIADMRYKVERIARTAEISPQEAKTMIKLQNKKRRYYHDYFCDVKWGDSRNYDICVNSSKLGLDGTADLLETFIREKIRMQEAKAAKQQGDSRKK